MLDTTGPVSLHAGPLSGMVCPRAGGTVASLTLDTPSGPVDLMRPTSATAIAGDGHPTDFACFAMLPFSNRIADGRFAFGDGVVSLPRDEPWCRHAIHGHGWKAAWEVEARSENTVRLTYRHRASAWPWTYRATQTFTLGPDRLDVRLGLFNESDRPMPAGFGLHPYFPKPPGTVVSAGVSDVWLGDDSNLPHRRIPVSRSPWALPHGMAMDGVAVDNGFTGWSGRAAVDWPERQLRLRIEADGSFGHLVVYAPPDGDFVCVEPVTHMTDAVNRPDEPDGGVHHLPPGECLKGTVRFIVERR